MRLIDAERLKLILRNSEYMDAFVDENGNTLYSDHLLVGADYDDVCKAIDEQPTVEPEKEIPKRVLWNGWKGMRDTRYKCPNCKKPVRNTDIYCHRCGQKLMFPNISFTPYVEGQKQELIVRWDDEE